MYVNSKHSPSLGGVSRLKTEAFAVQEAKYLQFLLFNGTTARTTSQLHFRLSGVWRLSAYSTLVFICVRI
jgi:hypothetical protein